MVGRASWFRIGSAALLVVAVIVGCSGGGKGGSDDDDDGASPTPTPTATPTPTPSVLLWEVTSNPSTSYDAPRALRVDGSALFIAGLYSPVPGDSDYGWRIEKRAILDGALDGSFGISGFVSEDPSPLYSDQPVSITLDPNDGSMYVAGDDSTAGYNDQQWRIEKRSRSAGARVATFASSGAFTFNPSATGDLVNATAIDASTLYVVGSSEYYSGQSTLAAIDLDTGSPLWMVTTSSGTPGNFSGMALDGGSLYLAGNDDVPGHRQWRLEKRSATDGSLVTAFGTMGVIQESIGSSDAYALAIVVDGGSVFVGGYDSATGSAEWRLEKRDPTTGALNTSFGTGGVVLADHSVPGSDHIVRLLPFAGALYVAGTTQPGNLYSGWRVERRALADGSLVAVAGTSAETTSFGYLLGDVTADADRLYIAYLTSAGGSDFGQWRIQARTP